MSENIPEKKESQIRSRARRAFLKRMLIETKKVESLEAELKATKDIFNEYPFEFISKVAKPPFNINSLFFFKTEDGKKYLQRKLKEFLYKPKSYDIVEGDKKVGEDWTGDKKKGFWEFLKED